MKLNQLAANLCDRMAEQADRFRIAVHETPDGSRVIDCGVEVPGGLEAGRLMAEICLAGLGSVELFPSPAEPWCVPGLAVRTDHPVEACMKSQYAGWQVAVEGYFAMGSGPMRALVAKESLFEQIGPGEREDVAVGVLETSVLPPPEVCGHLARACGVEPSNLTLLVAPTASQAGTVQVVARSVESALHKLFELGFELPRVESGYGFAPLPPVAGDDLAAMGRTNDAILYGAEVTLWVRGDDEELRRLGPKIPSNSSPEHGQPFGAIFQRHGRDFYGIDPNLFGPAVVTLFNLDTGRSHRFGRKLPDTIAKSFAS